MRWLPIFVIFVAGCASTPAPAPLPKASARPVKPKITVPVPTVPQMASNETPAPAPDLSTTPEPVAVPAAPPAQRMPMTPDYLESMTPSGSDPLGISYKQTWSMLRSHSNMISATRRWETARVMAERVWEYRIAVITEEKRLNDKFNLWGTHFECHLYPDQIDRQYFVVFNTCLAEILDLERDPTRYEYKIENIAHPDILRMQALKKNVEDYFSDPVHFKEIDQARAEAADVARAEAERKAKENFLNHN